MNSPVELSTSTSVRRAVIAAMLAGAACHAGAGERSPATAAASRVAALHAFARLYGVVRWFHPSDAAAVIDWDRFAIDGARRVAAADGRALRTMLAELIAPFAPTVQIAAAGEPVAAAPALHPPGANGLELVAWEHEGYGDSTLISAYASKRRHRPRTVAVPGETFASLWQAVDAAPYRGARIRLRGKLRTANHALGRLWLRVDRGDQRGFFDNMREHPTVGASWQPAEITGTVDADATRIVLGTIMSGGGTVWYDDLELAAEGPGGTWRAIELKDPGFEGKDLQASWSPGTGKAAGGSLAGWNATLDHASPASGEASLRVEPATRVLSDELFADAPAPGEIADVDLGGGLHARVPLVLYSRDGRTIGDDPALARRSQAAPPAAPPAGFDSIAGVADVIVVWNALQHFWPYWSVVAVDWNAELDRALGDALDDRSVTDHLATLQRLSAAAPDGHAGTTCPGDTPHVRPPFVVDSVEGQIIVTATADQAVARGDVVVSVEGHPVAEQLAADQALISGSPQWRLAQALEHLGAGPSGSTLALRVRRDGAERDVAVVRGSPPPRELSHPPIERLDDGVYYVDLERAAMPEINAVMDRLATAPGVVFDLREYPGFSHDVLWHLATQELDFTQGMSIPLLIRPDHGPNAAPTWETSPTLLPPLQPHIAGRVAFVTGARAISYAESLMALVEHHRLGAIIGSPTAGTNGNVAEISEPTGCRTRFTAMRVTRYDGAPQHLVGIRPTIPATRTIAGVAAGRDEVLDKALAYVRTTPK
jgi:C-terminal processing protease CtpA/Prc